MPLQTAKLLKKIDLTNDVIELSFEPNAPFSFQAGQFISIKVVDNPASPVIRGYSISSKPALDSSNFELCIKIVENGRGSNWLNSLKPNDEIQFLGPTGKFVFDETFTGTSLFIATGTGISPLKAMIEDQLLNKNTTRKIHLLFGVRYISGVFYGEIFKNLATKFPNFTYELTISRPEKEDYTGNKGRVTDLLRNQQLDPASTKAYMCGLKEMIVEVSTILDQKGLPKDCVLFEQYD
jgi:NAD(P)H-flavin reductase